MSAERTLLLKIDPSDLKEAIKKLENAGLGTRGGGSSSSQGSSSNVYQMFGSKAKIFTALAKISFIAAAVALIAKAVQMIASRIVDSSPILQTMLTLMNTAITFILRPIGDFIAFFLRPLIIIFLRQVAIPMYKTWGPIMRNLGTFLGTGFAAELKSVFGPREERTDKLHEDIMTKQQDNVKNITKFFNDIKVAILGLSISEIKFPEIDMSGLQSGFDTWITAINERITVGFGIFGKNFENNVIIPLQNLNIDFSGAADLFNNMWITLSTAFGSIAPRFEEFSVWITGVIESAKLPLESAIATITGFFDTIRNFFIDLIETITTAFSSIPDLIFGGGNGGNKNGGSVTNNFFEGAILSGQDLINDIFNWGEGIGNGMNDLLSGRGS